MSALIQWLDEGAEAKRNAAMTFRFGQTEVRTLERSGQVWFVAADVCKALGLTQPNKMLLSLDEDERGGGTVFRPLAATSRSASSTSPGCTR